MTQSLGDRVAQGVTTLFPEKFAIHPFQWVFESTYFRLRFGLGFVAFGLPIYLVLRGELSGNVDLQSSLSAYYSAGDGAMRDEFVAAVGAIGVMLILYKGFNRFEHWALNIAGVSAIGVALVPEGTSDWHGYFAIAFFISAGYVALIRSQDTLSKIADPRRRRATGLFYWLLSAFMVGSVLLAVVFARGVRTQSTSSSGPRRPLCCRSGCTGSPKRLGIIYMTP